MNEFNEIRLTQEAYYDIAPHITLLSILSQTRYSTVET